MKPTAYELLKAFLYAENTESSSGIPDDVYLQIREFVRQKEEIRDRGTVWRSGEWIYKSLVRLVAVPSREGRL